MLAYDGTKLVLENQQVDRASQTRSRAAEEFR
jgi:hypothetical protein